MAKNNKPSAKAKPVAAAKKDTKVDAKSKDIKKEQEVKPKGTPSKQTPKKVEKNGK